MGKSRKRRSYKTETDSTLIQERNWVAKNNYNIGGAHEDKRRKRPKHRPDYRTGL